MNGLVPNLVKYWDGKAKHGWHFVSLRAVSPACCFLPLGQWDSVEMWFSFLAGFGHSWTVGIEMFSMQQSLSSELMHSQAACRDCAPFSQVPSPYNSQEGFMGSKSPRKCF